MFFTALKSTTTVAINNQLCLIITAFIRGLIKVQDIKIEVEIPLKVAGLNDHDEYISRLSELCRTFLTLLQNVLSKYSVKMGIVFILYGTNEIATLIKFLLTQ